MGKWELTVMDDRTRIRTLVWIHATLPEHRVLA